MRILVKGRVQKEEKAIMRRSIDKEKSTELAETSIRKKPNLTSGVKGMTRENKSLGKTFRSSKKNLILAMFFGVTGGIPLALLLLGTILLSLHFKFFELLGFINGISFSVRFLNYRVVFFKTDTPPAFTGKESQEVH